MEPPSPLISALLDPARYPHPVERVDLLETHGAWVLLAGEFAYKIKKPVRFPFMDFSSLPLRRQACETEIQINRRFQSHDRPATHLYLGVLPLLGTPEQPRWGEAEHADDAAQAIEWAVQMRRFDEASRLDHVCQRGELTAQHIKALARRMVQFQSRAPAADPSQPWGHPAAAMRWPRDNFNALRAALTDPADAALVRELSEWTEQRFSAIEPLLARRRQKERVREGHGDLHLANMVLIEDEVLPFDGIEFSEELRWIDVANDMAFAWMDLLGHDRPGLANALLSDWLDASGDVSAPTVWSFFASYRAGVRAKVAALRMVQLGSAGASPEADASLAESRRYLALARQITHPPEPPRLVITHGLSGSGKTWASGRWLLAEDSGRTIRLRSDVERKRLHGMSALAPSGSFLNMGIYTQQAHKDTYASLLARTRMLLNDGWSVVVDAAFLRRGERNAFAALARITGASFHIIAPEAPVEILRRRIEERTAQRNDASEATLAVLEQQLSWFEPLDDEERAQCLPATT
jgi:uncharacterized protein